MMHHPAALTERRLLLPGPDLIQDGADSSGGQVACGRSVPVGEAGTLALQVHADLRRVEMAALPLVEDLADDLGGSLAGRSADVSGGPAGHLVPGPGKHRCQPVPVVVDGSVDA